MKRIDRLIIGEIFGPWIFGVAIFTVLIVAGTFLYQFTEFVVKGISPITVLTLMSLVLPGVLAKTFPMAILLGTLLGFGRLSGDSEITALRAAGTSLVRLLAPVGVFGMLVTFGAFFLTEFVVPAASFRATQMRDEIKTKIEGSSNQATSYPIYRTIKVGDKETKKLDAMVVAKDFSIATGVLTGVTILAYDANGERSFTLDAKSMEYIPASKFLGSAEPKWKILGNAKFASVDGKFVVEMTDGAWPMQIPKPTFKPEDVFVNNLKDLDSQSMSQILERIDKAKEAKNVTVGQIANLEYGYWNKIAVPLSAFVFALVGAPLGIRNHRTGASAGFWMAVMIIFGYLVLSTFMNTLNQGGKLPAWLPAFAPVVIGLIAAGLTIRAKDK